MKKLLFLILITLVSFSTYAQNVSKEQKTVSVTGSTAIKRELVAYKAKITLNMDQAYYANPECKTLEEFKELYFEKVKKNGIDPVKFKENKLEFLTYGYQKDGTVFSYESTSKETIEKLASIKMPGLTYSHSFKYEISEAQRRTFLKNALNAAEKNARRICQASGRKIKEIISIQETSPMLGLWKSYHQAYEEYTTVHVTYKVE